MDKSLLELISITGRFAFGVTCLERLCEEWQIKNQQINELIELLWTFTSSDDLSVWDKHVYDALPEYIYEIPIKFGYEFLHKDKKKILTDVILEIIEIGMANSYGGFKSEYTMVHTLNVINLLETNNIALPDLKPFQKSKVSELHGWGNRVDRDFFSAE